MKQDYITPEIEAIELASEVLMNMTSGETGEAGTGEGFTGDGDPDLTHRRRGTWGNFWE